MRRWWRSQAASRHTTEDAHGGTTVTALLQAPISGTVAVGTNIDQRVLNLGGVHGGVVTIIDGAVASPTARQRPVLLRPVRPELILDRQPLRELARPTAIVRELELYGEAGSGKTTLLEELAWTVADSDYPDGVVFLSLNSCQVNDALYDIWSAFYECPTAFKPVDAQLRIDLKPVGALVLLDDLDLEPAELQHILHLLPNCRCIVAGHERRLWGEGRSIPLTGLPMEDAIPLLEHGIGRALSPDERALAHALWQSTAGLPLRLLQSFAAVQDRQSRTEPAAAGGLPPSKAEQAAPAQADVADQAALDQLLAGRLTEGATLTSYVESQTDPWRASALAQLSRQSPERGVGTDTARLQLEQSLIDWGLRTGRYEPALRLARSTEAALALSGHWDAWRQLLERVQSAALDAADEQTQAWALHQLGSRALCLDELATAQAALAASLELRTRIGDDGGAAVTRHNLQLADHAVWPLAGARPRRWTALLAVSALVVVLAVGGVADAGQRWPFHPRAGHTAASLRSSSPLSSPSSTFTVASSSTLPPPVSSTPPSTSDSTLPPPTSSTPPPTSASASTSATSEIVANPAAMRFPPTTVGETRNQTESLTVSGAGHLDVHIAPGQSEFKIYNPCSDRTSVGSTGYTCLVTVVFEPVDGLPATATLIATLPDGQQISVPLSGNGVIAQVTIDIVNTSPNGYTPPGPVITGSVITKGDVSCPTACTVTVDAGTVVSLTAAQCADQPSCSGGVVFVSWQGDVCSGTALTCQFKALPSANGKNITVSYSYSSN